MNLSNFQIFSLIIIIMFATVITRFLPFLIFPAHKKTPKSIQYLGETLPFATIGMLLIYCLKDINLTTAPFALPQAVAILSIVLVHLWKRNTLISIATGTALYMFLVQSV